MLGQRFVRDPSRKRERDPRIAAPDGIRPLLAALFCADMSSIGVGIVTLDSGATNDTCPQACARLSGNRVAKPSTPGHVERLRRDPRGFPMVTTEQSGL